MIMKMQFSVVISLYMKLCWTKYDIWGELTYYKDSICNISISLKVDLYGASEEELACSLCPGGGGVMDIYPSRECIINCSPIHVVISDTCIHKSVLENDSMQAERNT